MSEGVSLNATNVEMSDNGVQNETRSNGLSSDVNNNNGEEDDSATFGSGNEDDNDSCTNNGTGTASSSSSTSLNIKPIPFENRNSSVSVDINAIASAAGAVEAGESITTTFTGADDILGVTNAAAAARSNSLSTNFDPTMNIDLLQNYSNDVTSMISTSGIDTLIPQQPHHHQQQQQQQQHHQTTMQGYVNTNASVMQRNESQQSEIGAYNSGTYLDDGEEEKVIAASMTVERVNEIASTLSTSGSNSGRSGNSSHNSIISSANREEMAVSSGLSTGINPSASAGPMTATMTAPIPAQIPNLQQQLQHVPSHHQPQHSSDHNIQLSPIFPNLPDPNNNNQQQQQQQYNHLPRREYSNDNMHLSHISSTTMSPVYVDFNQQQMQQQRPNQSPSTPTQSGAPPLQPHLTTMTNNPQQPQPPSSNIDEITNAPEMNFESILKSPKNKDDIVEVSPGERYLRFSEKLGSGAYKNVYRAYDTIEGIEVAWNAVTLTGVPKSQRQYIVNEVRLLEKLNHANIISFHGSWVNRELEQVIFVTEILSSGTLKSFIEKVQVIRWKIAKRWAKQILYGLEYLHSQDPPIVHRDLKCDNIFINGTSGDLRIGDLGLSTFINKSHEKQILSVLGTPEFMAPELYNELYDQAVDIYAFGMCLLEIFTKEVPYGECSNPAQIYKKVTSGVEPASINRIRSSHARDFIRLCLGTPDGQGGYMRPSAKELLNHPFLEIREDDDSEVEVDKPIQEVRIAEGPSLTDTVPPHHSQREQPRQENKSDSERSLPQMVINNAVNSENHSAINQGNHVMNGDVSDFINGMPDRESNMKNVSVLMGRRQQNDNAENDHQGNMILSQQHAPQQQTPAPLVTQQTHMSAPSQPVQQHSAQQQNQIQLVGLMQTHVATSSKPIQQHATQQPGPIMTQPPHLTSGLPQELVGQVVGDIIDLVDYKKQGIPYANDIMRLRMTIFVQNQEKQVEFDFHLINDDPVAVAHEMVTELHLPKEAVLELSEKISRVARYGRISQDQYKKQQLAQQESQSVSLSQLEEPNVAFKTSALNPSTETNNQLNQINQFEVAEINGESMQNIQYESKPSTNLLSHHHSQTNSLAATIAAPGVPPNVQDITTIQSKHKLGQTADLQQENPILLNIDTDDDSTSNLSEIKKLKIDFENKVKRTNKAYQTRMENLIRSKEEKEALHLKTVEKHEKEQLAFQKRVKQAEKEQEERMQKIQKEFEARKAKALQLKQASAQDQNSTNSNVESSMSTSKSTNVNNDTSMTEEGKMQSPSPTFSLDGKNNI